MWHFWKIQVKNGCERSHSCPRVIKDDLRGFNTNPVVLKLFFFQPGTLDSTLTLVFGPLYIVTLIKL